MMSDKSHAIFIYFLGVHLLVISRSIFLSTTGSSIIFENRELKNKDEVILGCPYALEPNDEKGLVVAWYYDDYPYPFYQWIPFSIPQVIGMFRDHIDVNYVSSMDPYYRHSNVRFIHPVTNLTGKYKCKVSSFADEKIYVMHLIVFSTPTLFTMDVEREAPESVAVVCKVEFIYPEPRLYLYRDIHHKRVPMENGLLKTNWAEGAYNVTIKAGIDDIQLDGMTEFACHLDIPQTNISMERAIKYLPRTSPQQGTKVSSIASSTLKSSLKIFTICFMSTLILFKYSS